MNPPNRTGETLDRDARLANRATLLTLLSLCSFLLAVVALPLTFQRTESAAPRVVASAPLVLGVGAGLAARGIRGQLRALRDERDAPAAERAQGDERGAGEA